jgi:Ca2+-transporting ATPase
LHAQAKDAEALARLGGLEGMARALRVRPEQGLDPAAGGDVSLERRKALFGVNKFAEVPLQGFFALLWDNLRDQVLILLMAAATVGSPWLRLHPAPITPRMPAQAMHRACSSPR